MPQDKQYSQLAKKLVEAPKPQKVTGRHAVNSIKVVGLRTHMTKLGHDYELLDWALSHGIDKIVAIQRLYDKNGVRPRSNTVRKWINAWKEEHADV